VRQPEAAFAAAAVQVALQQLEPQAGARVHAFDSVISAVGNLASSKERPGESPADEPCLAAEKQRAATLSSTGQTQRHSRDWPGRSGGVACCARHRSEGF